jgi:chaperonin GroEL (HSP60 family)
LQAKHANGEHQYGVDGDTGKVTDMKTYGLLESASVKIQTLKTAIEVSEFVESCVVVIADSPQSFSPPSFCCVLTTSLVRDVSFRWCSLRFVQY